MIYYIYHIFGKKIGVTCDLDNRLTRQQGYSVGEYEVLDFSEDIDYISQRELELQIIYGYSVDRILYKDLINKKSNKKEKCMRTNTTEQTTTFYCPLKKLKGQLLDNLGTVIETPFGKVMIDNEMCNWIVSNATTSMYDREKCFVYNKAMYEHFNGLLINIEVIDEGLVEVNVFDLIREWADSRGIYESGDSKTQFVKLQEESGELARAILKKDEPELIDAIGDMVVVLTNLAALNGLKIEDCVTSAYDVIKSRKGKMVGGTFVKEQPKIQSEVDNDFLGSYRNGINKMTSYVTSSTL